MLERKTKLFILIFLILATISILISSRNSDINSPKTPNTNGQTPIRRIWLTLAQNQHDQLFEQLRKFANKHAFTIRISQIDPTGENFLVLMQRSDVEIDGFDSGDPGLFKISFFNAYEDQPVSLEVVDELILDLKGFIEEIPNTTFTVKE